MSVPRLRMFAGPNGSGKSTIKSVVPSKLLGVYLNPDEIQKEIEDRGFLDVRHYGEETTREIGVSVQRLDTMPPLLSIVGAQLFKAFRWLVEAARA